MIERIISFSVNNKLITGILLFIFVCWGSYSVSQLSIDALPDVTNNQVQVTTSAPNLATQEVEQFITYPLELQFKNLPDLVELRSISRSGLSVITIVFKDNVPVNVARQLVSERIKSAEEQIPTQYGLPEIVPPTTGLGEIYQYTLALDSGYKKQYSAMDLRTFQDWIVRKQLLGVPGVVDVSSFGGFLKQYEVAVQPEKLLAMNVSLIDVFNALSKNNENTGGSYIDKGPNIYFIRGEGLIQSLNDIENIVIRNSEGIPLRIRDVGIVQFGYAPRYGAMSRNGEGETVGGVVLMMKGANSVEVIKSVKERMSQIQKSLPEGIMIDAFVDRTKLINKTIGTVQENLFIGALIVILILILILGNIRAGLIVASVIPLSLLFAIVMMNIFGISANLMSMGALDFGLIVDGAVIVVESIMFLLHNRYKRSVLTQEQMNHEVIGSSAGIMRNAVFGQFIILIVYIPIFALIGIEGKMFRPMAQTVSFSIIGALLLSLTYVPLMTSIFLNKKITEKESWSDRMINRIQKVYSPFLEKVLRRKKVVIYSSLALVFIALIIFNRLGGEFIPELDEGDFAVNYTIRQGSNLNQTITVGTQLEKILLNNFPEVKEVVSKIGTSEVPTDPMPIESADLIIVMKDKEEWQSATDREMMAEKMNEKLSVIPGVNLSFEQPIQMRFNELIAGVKRDIAIKIYGEDLNLLFSKANEASAIVARVNGAVDIKVEQVVGMPQLVVKYNRERIAQYGLNISDVNQVLNSALAGGRAGVVYEGEKRFDLVVRLANYRDADEEKVKNIFIPLNDGQQIPLGQLASVSFVSAPSQVSRENGERRIVIETNVRGRDIQSVALEISDLLSKNLKLPPGYYIEYGGTFKNLQEAKGRLSIAVPAALLLILFLLFLTFRRLNEALIIFSAIPLAAIGGVFALWLRNMNFSISAGIGFIALFGVAVLNGIVLISYFNKLEQEGEDEIIKRVIKGTAARLRPVLATAAVASLGFLPMALSTSEGSEVQKPLATVVIGGLISSTLLTLIVLPVLYAMFASRKKIVKIPVVLMIIISIFLSLPAKAQTLTLDSCISLAQQNHPVVKGALYQLEQQKQLKKTAFSLDPINVIYEWGQINNSFNDYYINAVTGIQNPLTIARLYSLQKEKITLSEKQLIAVKAQLVRDVSIVYYQLFNANEKLKILIELDSIYSEFASYAERKFTVGESNLLEKVSAQAQLKQIRLNRMQLESEMKIFKIQLQQFTGVQNISVTTEWKQQLSPSQVDSTSTEQNPWFRVQQQQVKVSEAEWKAQKSRWIPSFQFGAFNQSLEKKAPFWGYSVGATIPIFKTGQSSRVNAGRLQSKISQMDFENFKLVLNTEYIRAIQQFRQYQEQINYFNAEGLNMATTLTNAASRSYQAGDIGYVEFIQAMNQSLDIRFNYLTALNNYNQSIININYLLNK